MTRKLSDEELAEVRKNAQEILQSQAWQDAVKEQREKEAKLRLEEDRYQKDNWLDGETWDYMPTLDKPFVGFGTSSETHLLTLSAHLEEERLKALGAIAAAAISGESSEGVHALKTWPDEFQAIVRGDKTFDLRTNDRGFKVGDVLVLREYDPETQEYSGEVKVAKVSYILMGGSFGLPEHLCIMSLQIAPTTLIIVPREL